MVRLADFQPATGDALLIIDPQNDFLPGGALAVTGGDAVIAPLQAWIDRFVRDRRPILATRDCHPADHCSFREHGGPWPAHCVAGSWGASIAPALKLPTTALIIDKPCRADIETYDGFSGTRLDETLRQQAIQRLWVGGLATDYCVLNTVLEGLRRGYQVFVLTRAVRAVDLKPGDGQRALEAMAARGAVLRDDPP
ncbi:MAG: isochorismatase family protein [Methylococcus sp.]|nr:MAG: isochorismatase family protein [Methylococcus sp.]